MAGRNAAFTGPGMMVISAVLFGYFGFAIGLSTVSQVTGQPVPTWVLLVWTLRGSAVGFAVAAALTFVAPWPANLLYSVVGLVGAALLIGVLILDQLDKQHAAGISPFLLVIFAVWNGYGSWSGLRALLARPAAPREEPER